jgi:hypothetical protein
MAGRVPRDPPKNSSSIQRKKQDHLSLKNPVSAGSNRAQGNVPMAAARAGVAFGPPAFAAATAAAERAAHRVDILAARGLSAASTAVSDARRSAAAAGTRAKINRRTHRTCCAPHLRTP